MFERYVLKSIHVDEAVIRIVRASVLHYRWSLIISSVILITSFFLLYPLLTLRVWGVALFVALCTIAFIGYIRTLIIWSLNVFIVTNRRIIDIDQRGVFEKHVAECPLENIQDIRYVKKGVLSTTCNIGTVIVQSGGGKGRIEFVDVPKPEEVKELIMNVQHHHNKKSAEEQEI